MNYGKKSTSNKQKKLSSNKSKWLGKAKIIFLRLLLLTCIAAVAAVCYVGYDIVHNVIADAPSITAADVKPQGYTSFVVDQNGKELQRFVAANANRVWVSIDDLPEYVGNAFVAIEDERYYEHNGIDIQGIFRAAFKGIASGFHFSEGASTITQQLIKNTIYQRGGNEGEGYP